MDQEPLIEAIRKCCIQREAVLAAYLFGSAASGRMKPTSDVDLAVLVDSKHERDFPALALAADLERELGRPVDLIILNRAGELLKYQVRRYGRLVFDRDPCRRKHFEIMGRKLFEDFIHLHGKYTSGLLYRRQE